jgi:hypothetical protein
LAARGDQTFRVRIPRDLDEWIEQQAKANCRSKTGEIEFRLKEARRFAERLPRTECGENPPPMGGMMPDSDAR